MKNNRITFRVSDDLKNQLTLEANKINMNVSEYVDKAVNEKINNNKLNDSQEQFVNLFDVSFIRSYESYYNKQLRILNSIDYNIKTLLEILDVFMYHVNVPNERKDIMVSYVEHPIKTIAKEKVLKDIRSMKEKKGNIENE